MLNKKRTVTLDSRFHGNDTAECKHPLLSSPRRRGSSQCFSIAAKTILGVICAFTTCWAEVKFDPLNESSPEEIMVYQELAKRSEEISAREATLKQHALILKAAEASMSEKLKHFDLLKKELLKMLERLQIRDEKQLDDLVKIYVNMKPKHAASIFNQMDMQLLKDIIRRMDKKKAAFILAVMDTKKAKDLSQNLAKDGQEIN